MTENNAKLKKINQYKFNESDDDFKAKLSKKPPAPKSEIKTKIHHAVDENEYEKFRRTFKDADDSQNHLANSQSDSKSNVSFLKIKYLYSSEMKRRKYQWTIRNMGISNYLHQLKRSS